MFVRCISCTKSFKMFVLKLEEFPTSARFIKSKGSIFRLQKSRWAVMGVYVSIGGQILDFRRSIYL